MARPGDVEWPGAPAAVVLRVRDGVVERVREFGDLDEPRPWASVSKLAVALAVGVEVEWGTHRYEESTGPDGATLANLLSHSAGLGMEEGDRTVPVATARIYSNAGIERAVTQIVGEAPPGQWLDNRVFAALGMATTRLDGRSAAGVVGSTNDLATFAAAWLRPDVVARPTRDRIITPYVPDLAGIVPGWGRFRPCPWGLGPEVRGDKRHWMGEWPPESFGHFGQSGALLLANVAEQVAVVATSTVPFGAWAKELWPRWTTEALALARGA